MVLRILTYLNTKNLLVRITLTVSILFPAMNCNSPSSQENVTPILLSRLFLHRDRIRILGQALGPGALINATVNVFPIPNSGYCYENGSLNSGNQILSSGKTDQFGQFSLAYISVGKPICIVVIGDTDTTMNVLIPKSKKNETISWENGVHYSAIVLEPDPYTSTRGADGLYKVVTLSPFTSILESRFQGLRIINNATIKTNIEKANNDVLYAFLNGLTGKVEELDPSSENYRMRLSGITQLADSGGDEIYNSTSKITTSTSNNGTVTMKDINTLLMYMNNDFTDGIFNGKKLETNNATTTVSYVNFDTSILSTFITVKFRNAIHMSLINLGAEDLPPQLIDSQKFFDSSP